MTGWGSMSFPPNGGGGGGGGGGSPLIPDATISEYATVSAVPKNTITNIINYTTPAQLVNLVRVEFGGTNVARFWLFLDNVEKAQHLTWFGGTLNGSWDFSTTIGGLPLPSGTNIKVKVEHSNPASPTPAEFYARITAIKIDP